MIELRIGDVVRARKWNHCADFAEFNFSVGKGSKDVALFIYVGSEPRDGSTPLDVEERMRQLGWVRSDR